MIEQQRFFRIAAFLVLISLLFGLLSFLKIQYQFYILEVLIDLKVIAMVGLLYVSYRKKELIFSRSQLSLFSFDWKNNVVMFFVPLVLYAVTIGIGIAASELKINKLDNAATLVLATIFDIPAIYVFSATSILLEELVFRGILLSSFERSYGSARAVTLVSSLWMVFMLSDVLGMENNNLALSGTVLLFFMSTGILLSVLSLWKGNVWLGYSLRIGIVTITPIVLTSRINESDSFFTTESLFFFAEGLIIAMLFGLISIFVYRRSKKTPNVA